MLRHHGQRDERDERDAGHAVGLEAVGGRAHRVACVVACAVRDHAGVAGIVLLDAEHDLHEVGADVGDLGEDPARDAERGGPERLADREAQERCTRRLARHEQQDHEHHQQLDADQQHADAHAGLERDLIDRERLAAQRREGGAAVGVGVHADPEPRHRVGAEDADHRPHQDQQHLAGALVLEHAEVVDDAERDQALEHDQQPALLQDVGLARLPDDVGDVEHALVGGQGLHLPVHGEPEQPTQHAYPEAEQQQRPPRDRHSEELVLRVEDRQLEVQLARESGGRQRQGQGGERGGANRPGESPQGQT